MRTKSDRANSLAKVRLLAEVTASFAEELAAEVEEMASRPEPDYEDDDDGLADVRALFEGDVDA